jgi:hypothetical protein
MLQDYEKTVTLEITGDPSGTGSTSTATFEFVAGDPAIQIQESVRTGTVTSTGAQLLTTFFNEITDQEDALNEVVAIGLGTGQYTIEISFSSWGGATDFQGNTLQWGDTGDQSTLTKTDATGEPAPRQLSCLMYWIKNTRIDSLPEDLGGSLASGGPAKLSFGQHTSQGVYDPVDVILEEPSGTYSGEEPSTFTGTLTCVAVADLGETYDSEARTPRGT